MATHLPSLINQEAFTIHLKRKLNEGLVKAAEPILKKALDDMEKEMQKKLGSMVVGFIDSCMEVDRQGQTLRILVKHEK